MIGGEAFLVARDMENTERFDPDLIGDSFERFAQALSQLVVSIGFQRRLHQVPFILMLIYVALSRVRDALKKCSFNMD